MRWVVIAWTVWAAVACSGDDPGQDSDSDAGSDVEALLATVTETPVAREDFIELEVDGETREVAADQAIVLLTEEADTTAVRQALERELGATILGQLGDLGLLQVGVDADDVSGFEDAFAAIEAIDGVASATFHTPIEALAADDACEPPDDNLRFDLDFSPGCTYADIDYPGFAVVWDALGAIPLHPVTVAVVDTGVSAGCGAFDDTRHERLIPGETHTITQKHGTQVAGVIAADDLDDSTNGLASRFLGDKLTLMSRPVSGWGGFALFADMYRAGLRNADVVNVSMGQFPWPGVQVAQHEEAYTRLVNALPDTLFVVAAGNYGKVLTRMYPGAFQHPNMLTVGGTLICQRNQRDPRSNHGPKVHVAAPFTIPGISYHPTKAPTVTSMEIVRGTSFSTPIVSSVAAIIASIDPKLTPSRIADRIKDNTWSTNADVVHGSVVMSTPIFQTLYDAVPETRDALAPGGALATQASTVVSQFCGETTVTVEGTRSFEFPPSELLSDGLWSDTMVTATPIDGDTVAHLSIDVGRPALNETYAVPTKSTFSIGWYEGERQVVATGTSGKTTLTECTITGRRLDGSNEPELVRITLQSDGEAMVLGLPGEPLPVTRGYSAQAQVDVQVPYPASRATKEHIESICGQ